MRKLITTVLLLAAITFHSNAQQSTNENITIGGVTRNYRLFLPTGYVNATSPLPLLINIHGKTSSSSEHESYTNFKNLANTDNFVVVYPNSTVIQGITQWNVNNAENSSQDVQFISELIDYMTANYNINANRVYVVGFSNGGLMTSRLACEISNKIAAIGTVEGGMNYNIYNECNPQHPMPYLNIHGTNDTPVPYYGNGTMVPVEDVINYWKNYNSIAGNSVVSNIPNINLTDQSTAKRNVYNDALNRYRVTHIKIDGGGHSWAGSSTIIDITNQDFSASEALWKFVKRYTLNNLMAGIAPLDDDDRTQAEILAQDKDLITTSIDVNASPNPFNNELNINSNDNLVIQTVKIHNLVGQIIDVENISASNETSKINTSDWESGVYFLSTTDALGKTTTQKIIKR
jgi:polyhydroxybutyrate depolymerase